MLLGQLLRLLLVLLFHLLLSGVVSAFFRQLLMLLFLLLLEFLAFPVLLGLQLFLLLLIPLVELGVSRVWRSRMHSGRQLSGVHGRARMTGVSR